MIGSIKGVWTVYSKPYIKKEPIFKAVEKIEKSNSTRSYRPGDPGFLIDYTV